MQYIRDVEKPINQFKAPSLEQRGNVSSLSVYSHMKEVYNQGDEVKPGP